MDRARVFNTRVLAMVPALITAGLAVDRFGGAWGQPLVVVITAAVFLFLFRHATGDVRRMMVLCLVFASIGEVLLSLVWRVYDYRLDNLPLYVPPGHVLLFLLGIALSPHVSPRAVRIVTGASVLIAAWLAFTGKDTLSVVLVTVFVASVVFGRDRKLYATMFVLALAMELYGTWLGTWAWNAQVGATGLVTLNPPFAAGAFYCALDVLVMLSSRIRRQRA